MGGVDGAGAHTCTHTHKHNRPNASPAAKLSWRDCGFCGLQHAHASVLLHIACTWPYTLGCCIHAGLFAFAKHSAPPPHIPGSPCERKLTLSLQIVFPSQPSKWHQYSFPANPLASGRLSQPTYHPPNNNNNNNSNNNNNNQPASQLASQPAHTRPSPTSHHAAATHFPPYRRSPQVNIWRQWGLSPGPPACCAGVIPLHHVPIHNKAMSIVHNPTHKA